LARRPFNLYGVGESILSSGMSMASREDPFLWPERGLELYMENGFWWYRSSSPEADSYARQWMRVTDPGFHQEIDYALRSGGMKGNPHDPERAAIEFGRGLVRGRASTGFGTRPQQVRAWIKRAQRELDERREFLRSHGYEDDEATRRIEEKIAWWERALEAYRTGNPSAAEILLMPGPGLLEEGLAVAASLANPRRLRRVDWIRRFNETFAGKKQIFFSPHHNLWYAQDWDEAGRARLIQWFPREYEADSRRAAEQWAEEQLTVGNPATWTLDPRHVLRYGTVMRTPRPPARKRKPILKGRATVYKKVLISPTDDGWKTSLEPESLFDSVKDAKKFIDRWKRNPKRRAS